MSEMLPFRFKLLDYLNSRGTASAQTAMEDLRNEYGDKKYFRLKEVEEHFLSMNANGLAEEKDVKMCQDGTLETFYSITDYGKELLEKYLPAWYTR